MAEAPKAERIVLPAATLVLMRDRAGLPPLILMVERAQGMSFAGGATVFPGGRVDPGDRIVAADRALVGDSAPDDIDDASARVAAIRETIEEVGVAVGLDAPGEAIAILRAGLARGEPFGPLLAAAGLRLDLGLLTPFARWLPSLPAPKVFDTRFYAASVAAHADVDADGGETVHAEWITASDVIDQADAGHRYIIFPTRRNLERIAQYSGIEDLRAHTARFPARIISPWVEARADGDQLCIPTDAGYPVTGESLESALRGYKGPMPTPG